MLPLTLFGRTGLRVSSLCLGTMTFGTDWGWGADKEACRAVFERFAERGGNFIDTASNYTGGTSEEFVGDFVSRDRDYFVLGTKYSLTSRPADPNGGGNHRKNMLRSLEGSLRRLRTDYVDVYWLHVWDFLTPVDEVLRAMDDLVRAGKVLYVGISDVPAWIAAHAHGLAEVRGWPCFAGLQAEYSLAQRDAERDLLPMAHAFGMSVMPWSPLANGLLTGKYSSGAETTGRMAASSRSRNRPTTRGLEIADTVIAVAQDAGCSPAQLALAWLCRQSDAIIPIIGCTSLDQLEDNLECRSIELTANQEDRLDRASQIDLGFPHDFLAAPFTDEMVHGIVGDRLRVPAGPLRGVDRR